MRLNEVNNTVTFAVKTKIDTTMKCNYQVSTLQGRGKTTGARACHHTGLGLI